MDEELKSINCLIDYSHYEFVPELCVSAMLKLMVNFLYSNNLNSRDEIIKLRKTPIDLISAVKDSRDINYEDCTWLYNCYNNSKGYGMNSRIISKGNCFKMYGILVNLCELIGE